MGVVSKPVTTWCIQLNAEGTRHMRSWLPWSFWMHVNKQVSHGFHVLQQVESASQYLGTRGFFWVLS